jgi:hypothetical protein
MLASDALALKDIVTLFIASVGACLGVLNTWNAFSRQRVRLRVRPTYATMLPTGQSMFSIEVINLSAFPVTVFEVGFTIGRKGVDSGPRLAVPRPLIVDGQPWPRRLESRDSVSVYFDHKEVLGGGAPIGKAYARTSCGEACYGTGPALKDLRRATRSA